MDLTTNLDLSSKVSNLESHNSLPHLLIAGKPSNETVSKNVPPVIIKKREGLEQLQK